MDVHRCWLLLAFLTFVFIFLFGSEQFFSSLVECKLAHCQYLPMKYNSQTPHQSVILRNVILLFDQSIKCAESIQILFDKHVGLIILNRIQPYILQFVQTRLIMSYDLELFKLCHACERIINIETRAFKQKHLVQQVDVLLA